jgi:penicillin-binding protein 2
MYLRPEDRARPNRMALRIAVIGGFAVALFAVLFFRLWDLQVLEGAENLAQAKDNRTRSTKIIAPRGEILARNGEVLVDNRTSLALQVDPTGLPGGETERKEELKALGALVHMDLKQVLQRIGEEKKVVAAGAPVTIRSDVGTDLVYYIEENHGKFPGVTVEKVFVRNYPDGTEAAHIVGSTGEVSEEQVEDGQYKGTEPGEVVGQGGVEYTYDKYLRGMPGVSRYQVDASGEPTPGGRLTSTPPQPGDSLKLTINPAVQKAGEAALAKYGLPGGFVSMNIHTGEILGLGSSPTYDPSELVQPLSQAEVNRLYRNEAAPLTDRAVEGLYPTGSTYKIITALAGLENGVFTGSTVVNDNGMIEVGGQEFENSEGEVNGPISLVRALEVSSDVFFYEQGYKMWKTNYLQEWSTKMGIGQPTGIDLPQAPDTEGLVPSKQWTEEEEAKGNEYIEPWGPGQNIQLAVGQGYLQTDPLEMAIAYAALGNDGTIVTPHVGMQIQDAAGRVLKEFEPQPQRHVQLNPESRQMIMEGLHDVTSGPGGTATTTFQNFPVPVAGKTGTAERLSTEPNQAWFVSLAPYPDPEIVTVVTLEQGGFGAESAAPANLQILEAYFSKRLKKENEKEEKAAGGGAETGEVEEGYEGEETEGAEYEGPAYEEVEGGEEAYEEEAPPVEEGAVEEPLGEEAPVEEAPVETEGGGIG